jgi:hypothetical protein
MTAPGAERIELRPPVTAIQRSAALSKLIHDEGLSLGLSDLPQCTECVALSGLLTGLVQMARNGYAPEMCEQLVAEAAETLGLIEAES